MTPTVPPFDRLTRDQKEFWCGMSPTQQEPARVKAEAKKRQEATGKHASRDASGRLSPVPTVPEGPGESGEAVAQAAALVGLGATSVYQAKAVIDRAPELAKQVESGKISVDKAHKIMKRDGTPPDPNARRQPREKRIEDIRRLAVGADPDNAICAQVCIDLWSGPDHFDNRDRAILELIGWLVITREQFDTPAVGHA